jgi:ParB family chromosome partitioning protein
MMADDAAKSRLGRGLAALIGDVGDETAAIERVRSQRRVPVEFLRPNPRNPRRMFDEAELEDLANSIRQRGVIQPILVRTVRGAADAYEIIAGERRWRAAQRAEQHDVPIVLMEAGDRESLEMAVIENVQRADLNPIEEAMGYAALMEEFGHSQDDVAKIVGKSRPHVGNTLRLLKLSEPVKTLIHSGKLTAGHARMLVGQPNAEEFAHEIIEKGLNVRQVEEWARSSGDEQARELKPPRRGGKVRPLKDVDTIALEKRVSDVLGLEVSIDHHGNWGRVTVTYANLEQLDEVLRRLERA